METFSTLNLWLESKNDTVPYTSNSKSPYQENVANKSTILNVPSYLVTATSYRTSDITEVPDGNALSEEALGQLGDNKLV